MLGTRIKTQKLSTSNTIVQTACVGMKVHVTFTGEETPVSQRERIVCFSSCDCGETRSGDMIVFSNQAKTLIEGHTHNRYSWR